MFKRPKKELGQNFLQDETYQQKIVQGLGNLDQYESIIEIGPGRGALTKHLIESGKKITVIEFDRDLVAFWREQAYENLTVIESDILKIDFADILTENKNHAIIGNIPYNITSPIIFKLIENKSFFKRSVLMIQKEVAERVVASEGSKIFGILSIMAQIESDTEYLFDVPADVFFPVPKVDSAVIALDFAHTEKFNIANLPLFKHVVKTAFGQRRKMLRGSLKGILKAMNYSGNLDVTKRPEQLSIREFVDFVNELDSSKPFSSYG